MATFADSRAAVTCRRAALTASAADRRRIASARSAYSCSATVMRPAVAADPRFDGVTGMYFEGNKPALSSADSYDIGTARDLWETSERLLTHALG